MKLPAALIEELDQHAERKGASLTASEFRVVAERHGVPPATITTLIGRTERIEDLLARYKQSQLFSDLQALLECFPDGAEQFAAITDQLTQGLLPDPSAAMH